MHRPCQRSTQQKRTPPTIGTEADPLAFAASHSITSSPRDGHVRHSTFVARPPGLPWTDKWMDNFLRSPSPLTRRVDASSVTGTSGQGAC